MPVEYHFCNLCKQRKPGGRRAKELPDKPWVCMRCDNELDEPRRAADRLRRDKSHRPQDYPDWEEPSTKK